MKNFLARNTKGINLTVADTVDLSVLSPGILMELNSEGLLEICNSAVDKESINKIYFCNSHGDSVKFEGNKVISAIPLADRGNFSIELTEDDFAEYTSIERMMPGDIISIKNGKFTIQHEANPGVAKVLTKPRRLINGRYEISFQTWGTGEPMPNISIIDQSDLDKVFYCPFPTFNEGTAKLKGFNLPDNTDATAEVVEGAEYFEIKTEKEPQKTNKLTLGYSDLVTGIDLTIYAKAKNELAFHEGIVLISTDVTQDVAIKVSGGTINEVPVIIIEPRIGVNIGNIIVDRPVTTMESFIVDYERIIPGQGVYCICSNNVEISKNNPNQIMTWHDQLYIKESEMPAMLYIKAKDGLELETPGTPREFSEEEVECASPCAETKKLDSGFVLVPEPEINVTEAADLDKIFYFVENDSEGMPYEWSIGYISLSYDNLLEDMIVTVSDGFEISKTYFGTYDDEPITVDESTGNLDIYIRAEAGLTATELTGTLTIESQYVETLTYNLSGAILENKEPLIEIYPNILTFRHYYGETPQIKTITIYAEDLVENCGVTVSAPNEVLVNSTPAEEGDESWVAQYHIPYAQFQETGMATVYIMPVSDLEVDAYESLHMGFDTPGCSVLAEINIYVTDRPKIELDPISGQDQIWYIYDSDGEETPDYNEVDITFTPNGGILDDLIIDPTAGFKIKKPGGEYEDDSEPIIYSKDSLSEGVPITISVKVTGADKDETHLGAIVFSSYEMEEVQVPIVGYTRQDPPTLTTDPSPSLSINETEGYENITATFTIQATNLIPEQGLFVTMPSTADLPVYLNIGDLYYPPSKTPIWSEDTESSTSYWINPLLLDGSGNIELTLKLKEGLQADNYSEDIAIDTLGNVDTTITVDITIST